MWPYKGGLENVVEVELVAVVLVAIHIQEKEAEEADLKTGDVEPVAAFATLDLVVL
jgi:hypothetical protein